VKHFIVAALIALCVGLSAEAWALPQFSVLSARQCDNCHLDPAKWENPKVSERKCSLSCTSCHINPTGGGMRSTAGRFYGKEVLAMFGHKPSEGWQEPIGAASQPAGAGADAEAEGQWQASPPAGSAARYAGEDPTPWLRVGTDVRAMAYFNGRPGEGHAVFPMQLDLYLAGTVYNPEEYNKGRLTLLVNGGVLGSRSEKFSGFQDRFFLREWWALFDDLPYQLYGKLGQFLPAYGWRLDDHTSFIRQGQSFDNERQVTGLEVGLNPNYLYAHASIYANGPVSGRSLGGARHRAAVFLSNDGTPDAPYKAFDQGWGTAWSAGWRDLWWQAGASFMFEDRPTGTDLWAGANWALNLHEGQHPWKLLNLFPVTYMGEFDVRRTSPEGGRSSTGLSAFHELDVLVTEGLFFVARYDWQDPDIELKDDHRHRYTLGISAHLYTYLELIAQVRFNVEANEVPNDEALIQVHGWF